MDAKGSTPPGGGYVPGASAGLGPDPSWKWEEARWRKIVNKVRAGRRLVPRTWKDGARAAVSISFDSDHESWVLRDGGSSPAQLAAGEYGARAAVPRILRLLDTYGVRASFFVPAVIAKLYPDEQRQVVAAGHEMGIHGWIHERNSNLPPEAERDLMMRARDALAEITGREPVGLRTPSWDFSPHTIGIIREMGLLYDSSLMADDDPYEILEDGEPTGIVELPVEWIKDDYPYFGMDRLSAIRPYTPPSGVLEVWKREFDGAYEEGGLFLLATHPQLVGHRSRIMILEELIQYIRSRAGVWIATHEEIARYVKATA